MTAADGRATMGDPEAFVGYILGFRRRTDRLVDLIPPDRFDWRPDPGAFSFADLLRHLASVDRWMFAENARGRPSRYPGHGPDLADDPAGVLAYFRRLREEAADVFRGLGAEELAAPCTTPGGATMAVWKWLRAMVEHEGHHRGQLYLMLRMVGVETPPLFGLTSEEVRERSEPGIPGR